MSKILVTGVNGFVGQHVAKQLHEMQVQVLGVGNQAECDQNVQQYISEYLSCDLTDLLAVSGVNLKDVSAIINLAGLAKVGESRGQAERYNHVNVGVHTTLYDECLKQGVSPRIIVVSTGAVYNPNQPLPITEDSELITKDRTNEYVVSKLLMEEAVGKYIALGLRCIIVRPFNHTGPGQLPGFLLPDLGQQINDCIASGQPLLVGNLETKRDYTDVRDVAKAYVALATGDSTKITHDIYNICSGKSTPGKEILRLLLGSYGISDMPIEIDPKLLRPAGTEIMDIFGSYDRLKQATDWNPTIPIEQTVADYVSWKKSQR